MGNGVGHRPCNIRGSIVDQKTKIGKDYEYVFVTLEKLSIYYSVVIKNSNSRGRDSP